MIRAFNGSTHSRLFAFLDHRLVTFIQVCPPGSENLCQIELHEPWGLWMGPERLLEKGVSALI